MTIEDRLHMILLDRRLRGTTYRFWNSPLGWSLVDEQPDWDSRGRYWRFLTFDWIPTEGDCG